MTIASRQRESSTIESRFVPGVTYRLITETAPVSEEDDAEITAAMLETIYLSTRGDDPANFNAAYDGWRRFFSQPGWRARDYARLILGYSEGRLVNFMG